jgi:hypothetical protein
LWLLGRNSNTSATPAAPYFSFKTLKGEMDKKNCLYSIFRGNISMT